MRKSIATRLALMFAASALVGFALLGAALHRVLSGVDPNLTINSVRTIQQQVALRFNQDRAVASLAGLFGSVALLLAAVGLYGVTAYSVAQRTNEIGIRIALGAQRDQLLRLMLADGLRPALLGLALGLMASAGAARLIRSMLYETRPLDPTVFGWVVLALLLVATLACIAPAWRASRLDPAQALRSE